MVGERIRKERESKYRSFGRFYASCTNHGLDVSPATLSRWEQGQKIPAQNVVPIADALGLSLDELLRGPEWRSPDLPGIDPLQQDPPLVGATP